MRISLRGLSRQDRYLRLARWRDCCGAGAGDPDRPPRPSLRQLPLARARRSLCAK